ncbi:hypothetical protein DCAR_0935826 [Daucus carota subsp. sativus]|uniref:HMA domain-containing protein n=2 Tax=Daucus carota subsp. sativus TaxID=79200 RepID=A0AAF0Y2C0_DAUCS|nr:hypothetical protein DCAR_0935826 [Daucus carota subsp. sativus]
MTTMVLTVDLQCSCCYKKVKKILCKFPGITDQVYDEKNNQVRIKVLCCDPEKARDKLCCKGRKVIKSIQIVDDMPKKKEPEKVKPPAEKPADKPKPPAEKPADKPKPPAEKPADKPKPPAEKPKPPAEKPAEKPKPKDPAPEPAPICGPVHGFPPMYPNGPCCGSCAQGYGGGPCYQGFGRPVPPPPGPCYDYGRPVPCYDYGRPVPPPPGPCYDYGYGYRGSRCCVSTDYFSEENSQGCTIM